MAEPLQYWMMTRPHRKLIRVPQSIAAFASVAAARPWEGNRSLQIAFETELERNDLKRRGDHTERDRGRGGSGGRTHAAMLYSLGLFFTWKDSADAEEEVHLTLAGQALVDQQDALPILRRQVMAYQFPSAYSVGIHLDERFKLRPFVLLLRLLRDEDLNNYLTDADIAACVVTYGGSHSAKAARDIKDRILRFRSEGMDSLDADFAKRFGLAGSRTLRDHVYKSDGKLGAIANTVAQWLRYTGYAQEARGEDFGRTERTVTAINPNLTDEIDAAIEEWQGSIDTLSHLRSSTDGFQRHRAAAAFQRTYGRTPGGQKDQRAIGQLRGTSERTRVTGQITASLVHLYATEPLRSVTDEVIQAVVNHTGLPEAKVRSTLHDLIRSPQEGLSQFLDRYQQMAFSGTDEAIAFEQATASVMRDVFGLRANHVGQGGRLPDVEVWNEDWLGIVDTKAYAAYDLPSDHQLRMQTSYIPKYRENKAATSSLPDLAFFMYVAGGFAASFNGKLGLIKTATNMPGSGIGILPWIQLIQGYEASSLTHYGLRELWSVGREITPEDVSRALASS